MPEATSQPAASSLAVIPGFAFSASFLALLDAPPLTISLSFHIAANDLLRCKAVYYTDIRDNTAEKEWEVVLPRNSTLYKLITGETT